MKKITIKNRKGIKLVILPEIVRNQKGLAIVMHGHGGFKEQAQVRNTARVFRQAGFSTIRFDATNHLGESGGQTEESTVSNYLRDLEDVVKWAKKQKWYEEPFVLAGHSQGGLCALEFATRKPKLVKAIAPISTALSGILFKKTQDQQELSLWKKKGSWERISHSKPGAVIQMKWNFIDDFCKYDVIKKAHRIKAPVILIVGQFDPTTPLKHQKLLYRKLAGKKELHVIKGAEHTFRKKKFLEKVEVILKKWIKMNLL